MPSSCPECAAQMPDNAAFCPGCGRSMSTARLRIGLLNENVAGGIAYFTFIPAITFLLVAPYSRNRYVRFHSFQSLWLWVVCVLAAMAIRLLALVLFPVPWLGPFLVPLLAILAAIAAGMIWLVLVVKAFQGEVFQLPVVGPVAVQQAGSATSESH